MHTDVLPKLSVHAVPFLKRYFRDMLKEPVSTGLDCGLATLGWSCLFMPARVEMIFIVKGMGNAI